MTHKKCLRAALKSLAGRSVPNPAPRFCVQRFLTFNSNIQIPIHTNMLNFPGSPTFKHRSWLWPNGMRACRTWAGIRPGHSRTWRGWFPRPGVHQVPGEGVSATAEGRAAQPAASGTSSRWLAYNIVLYQTKAVFIKCVVLCFNGLKPDLSNLQLITKTTITN